MPGGALGWRHQTESCNAQTHLAFIDGDLLPHFYRRRHRVYRSQDNAPDHKQPEFLACCAQHHRQLAVIPLPPYAPDFIATERLWHYTRKPSTHDRYFDRPAALCPALFATFIARRSHPKKAKDC